MSFIHKSCQYADCVAFILPRSFKKYTFQDRIPINFHLAGEFECDEFVTVDGKPVSIKSVFQVWIKKPDNRVTPILKSNHTDFDMKHCHLSRIDTETLLQIRKEYPFCIPRREVGSKFYPRDSNTVTIGCHWFIKPHNSAVRSVFERLDFSFLNGMNTAFTSLSLKDIIRAYDAALTYNRSST